LPFENSANTYLKNPQSYSYQPQTGSKVVTYSPRNKTSASASWRRHFAFGSVPSLLGKAGKWKMPGRDSAGAYLTQAIIY